jgi:hypothetical protein
VLGDPLPAYGIEAARVTVGLCVPPDDAQQREPAEHEQQREHGDDGCGQSARRGRTIAEQQGEHADTGDQAGEEGDAPLTRLLVGAQACAQ